MSALWWNAEVREVSDALSGIGEWKFAISSSLRDKGFNDVRVNDLEVAGGKNNCWLSIGHFHIADRSYWEVVMCGGDTVETTKDTAEDVVTLLRELHPL